MRDALTVELDMWTMNRSSQFSFFYLVLGCCTILVYFSFRPKQNEEVKQNRYLAQRKYDFKPLWRHRHPPTCLPPTLENAEKTDVVGFRNKDNTPRVSVLLFQKDFRFPAGR